MKRTPLQNTLYGFTREPVTPLHGFTRGTLVVYQGVRQSKCARDGNEDRDFELGESRTFSRDRSNADVVGVRRCALPDTDSVSAEEL
jgi:hypothetical protein